MSRIGKQPVAILDKANVTINGNLVSVKGPNGELSYEHTPFVTVEQADKEIIVKPVDELRKLKLCGD